MPNLNKRQVIILIVAFFVLFGITEIAPNIISKVTPTTTIKYGELNIEEEAEGYIIRDEVVYSAKADGTVKYLAKENKQVKVGSKVIEFTESSNDSEENESYSNEITQSLGKSLITAKGNIAVKKGVFSTYVDGNEGYFTLKNFPKMTEKTVKEKLRKVKDIKETSVRENQPIYKISDQSHWYIVCFMPAEAMSKFEDNKNVIVKIGDQEIDFTVKEIKTSGEKCRLLLHSNRYYEKFAQLREVDITVRASNQEGILIPNEAIVNENGKYGVYVISKTGEKEFVQINILGSNDQQHVVSEGTFYDKNGNLVNTVKVFDEIIRKP